MEAAEQRFNRQHGVILLLESRQEIASVTGSELQELGYPVLRALTPEMAQTVAALCPNPIGCLLANLDQAGTGAAELVQRIAASHPGMCVLFYASNPDALTEIRDAIDAPAGILAEPLSPVELDRELQLLLAQRHSGATILVVDDEAVVRRVLVATLESAGYKTLEAGDGREAIDLLNRTPAALVVTDLIMPGQEGIETIRQLKRDFPRVKVIAISGVLLGGILQMASALGADAALAKPINRDEFLTVVRDVLYGRSIRGQ